MNMTVETALEIARSAKIDGMLNRHPQACIVLSEEIERLKRENAELREANDRT